MSDMKTFAEIMAEKFGKHPKLKTLAAEKVSALSGYFGSWAEMAAYETLANDFSLTEDEATTVLNVSAAVAKDAASRQDEMVLTAQMSAVASATATTTAPASPYGDYAHLMQGGKSAMGISSIALNPRIKPDFIRAAAQSAMAYVMVGTGVLRLFNKEFWRSMMLEDMELRAQISDLQHRMDSGSYITEAAFDELIAGVQKLFGPKFDALTRVVARMSAQTRTLEYVGAQGRVDVGEDAAEFGELGELLPLFAAEISQSMIQSTMPEQGMRVVRLVSDVMTILKSPVLQQYAGIVGATSPDEGVVMLLERKLGVQVANQVRLAMAYEALVNAFAECPAGEVMPPAYLKVVGALAMRLGTMFKLVAPDQEVSQAAAPFRQHASASSTSATASVGFGFSINLKFTKRS